jgi:hypothetical protein
MENSPPTGERRSRRLTRALIAAGCAFLGAGLVFGIADNPLGLALVYAAVTVWILAFAHHWRRPKPFLILLVASLAGFPLAAILHNLFYALGRVASESMILSQALGFLEVLFFLIAIFVCPPGVLVGAVGSVVLALGRLRKGRDAGEGKAGQDDALS